MAAANAVWSGFIRFGLVSLPVRVYGAAASGGGAPSLNQIHKGCGQRVQSKKVCPEHGDIPAGEMGLGYEHTKGQYVIIDPAEVARLRTAPDRSVQVEAFVPDGTIDDNYFSGQHYYLGPDGLAGHRPYALLHRVMSEQRLHAFATAYLRGRKQLMLVRPVGRVLGMSVLNFAAEVRPASMFESEVSPVELAPKELQLTKMLMESMLVDELDLSAHPDDYADNLKALIQAKIEGREVVDAPKQTTPQMVNLLEALERSIAESKKRKAPPAKKPPKQAAPGTAATRAKEATEPTRRRKSS